MAHRCKTARIVGTAHLQEYRLLFRGQNGSAVATVEQSVGSEVQCLVWEITPADEQSLDRYEGYPILYRKKTVSVILDGEQSDVMVYIMNGGRQTGMPSCYYYSTIIEGYRNAGFDTDKLKQAVEESIYGCED